MEERDEKVQEGAPQTDAPEVGSQQGATAREGTADDGMQVTAPQTDAASVVGAPGKGAPAIVKQTPEMEAVMGYDSQIAALRRAAAEAAPENEEERRKRERRERSHKIISAVVDGTRALANLYFTSQYAPDASDGQKLYLSKANERIEAMKAERKANEERYNNLMLRIGDVQNARAATLREMQAKQEAQKLARDKAKREAEAHGWQAILQRWKRAKAEQEAITAEAKAKYAPEMNKAELETERARKGSYEASAAASRASAANSYASARAHDRSNVNEFSAWDENGIEHKFESKDAADRFARQHGTWEETEVSSSKTTTGGKDKKGKPVTKTETTKKKSGYPGRPKQGDTSDQSGKEEKPFNPQDYKRGQSTETQTPPPLN